MTTPNEWLTLEAAAKATQTDVAILEECLKKDPEKQFHKYGLLYDRERRESGKTAYLQQLEPAQPEPAQARKPASEVSDRAYTCDNTPIRLEILWLPSTDGQDRKVLISATSYDDFPVSDLIAATQLDALPAPLLALLEELKADLPIRKLRYQQQQSKEQKSTHRPASLKPAAPASTPVTATPQTLHPNQTILTMITPDEPKVLVLLEQQQHWVKQSIAQNDELLRELFKVLHPKFAEADIKRDNGSIEIIPRKGTKGHRPAPEVLALLEASPTEIDPAIAACIALQQIELAEGLDPQNAKPLSQQIETAIAESEHWRQQIKQTLDRLETAPSSSIIAIGF